MRWSEVRAAYPDQWLIVEALEAHNEGDRRFFDRIAVLETCLDGSAAFRRYRELHRSFPERELCPLHTRREDLAIPERRWLGVRL
jgi:hypothetical protein